MWIYLRGRIGRVNPLNPADSPLALCVTYQVDRIITVTFRMNYLWLARGGVHQTNKKITSVK
jgi:hypothetical protein